MAHGQAAIALAPGAAAAVDLDAAFDHVRFCTDAKEIERQHNKQPGSWLDDHRRHDGMSVDCGERTVELQMFVQGSFSEFVGNWRDRTTYTWNQDYCTDPSWAAGINNQWRITLSVRSAAGELFSVRADCH